MSLILQLPEKIWRCSWKKEIYKTFNNKTDISNTDYIYFHTKLAGAKLKSYDSIVIRRERWKRKRTYFRSHDYDHTYETSN